MLIIAALFSGTPAWAGDELPFAAKGHAPKCDADALARPRRRPRGEGGLRKLLDDRLAFTRAMTGAHFTEASIQELIALPRSDVERLENVARSALTNVAIHLGLSIDVLRRGDRAAIKAALERLVQDLSTVGQPAVDESGEDGETEGLGRIDLTDRRTANEFALSPATHQWFLTEAVIEMMEWRCGAIVSDALKARARELMRDGESRAPRNVGRPVAGLLVTEGLIVRARETHHSECLRLRSDLERVLELHLTLAPRVRAAVVARRSSIRAPR